MKITTLALSMCFVAGTLANHAQAPTPSVSLGDVRIVMDSPEDKTIAALRQRFQNVDLATEPNAPIRQWMIAFGKERWSSPEVDVYAKDNRVIGAQLSQEILSMDEAFDALFREASKLADERRASCRVLTWTSYLPSQPGPGLSKASVSWDCGAYQLTLLRNQFKDSSEKLISGYMLLESFGTIPQSVQRP